MAGPNPRTHSLLSPHPSLSQAGRSSKRQLFLLPGGLERHLKIKTCTVSEGLALAGSHWRDKDTQSPEWAPKGTEPLSGACTAPKGRNYVSEEWTEP